MNILLLIVNYESLAAGIIMFGLILNSVNLPLSLRASVAATTLTNYPANILFYKIAKNYGRRSSFILLFAISGALLLLSTLFRELGYCDIGQDDQFSNVYVVLSLVVILAAQVAGFANGNILTGVYVQELFPTELRAAANMACAVSMGIGIAVSPMVFDWFMFISWLPVVIVAIMALVGALLAVWLPETSCLTNENRALNTLEEAHEFYRRNLKF